MRGALGRKYTGGVIRPICMMLIRCSKVSCIAVMYEKRRSNVIKALGMCATSCIHFVSPFGFLAGHKLSTWLLEKKQ